jgi:hypothetical protein
LSSSSSSSGSGSLSSSSSRRKTMFTVAPSKEAFLVYAQVRLSLHYNCNCNSTSPAAQLTASQSVSQPASSPAWPPTAPYPSLVANCRRCAHLAVWQDCARWVSQEADVPDADEPHQHRQVGLKGGLPEVVIHCVGTSKELLNLLWVGESQGRGVISF